MVRRPGDLLSDDEVERWAAIWADELSDPNSALRAQVLLGLQNPKTARAALPIVRLWGIKGRFRPKLIAPLRKLILTGDREALLDFCRKMLKTLPKSAIGLVHVMDRRHARKFLLAEANKVKGGRGHPSKSPIKGYADLADRAETLYPALLHLLQEMHRGTRHTVREILDFLAADHERAVAYLRKHIVTVQKAVSDPKYLKRAKRIETQARRLASGLAGLDVGYSFNTSVERVRQGRRIRKSSTPNSPQKD